MEVAAWKKEKCFGLLAELLSPTTYHSAKACGGALASSTGHP